MYGVLPSIAQIPGVSQAQPGHYYHERDDSGLFIKSVLQPPRIHRDTEDGSGPVDIGAEHDGLIGGMVLLLVQRKGRGERASAGR